MIRRLLTFASAIALLFSVVVAVQWVRSYWVADGVVWMDHGDGRLDHVNQVEMGNGWVMYTRRRCGGYKHRVWYSRAASSDDTNPASHPVSGHVLGCYLLAQPVGSLRGAIVPMWMLVCSTALLPFAVAVRHATAPRRRSPPHCSQCGYDLRASAGRCPECGTPVVASPQRLRTACVQNHQRHKME